MLHSPGDHATSGRIEAVLAVQQSSLAPLHLTRLSQEGCLFSALLRRDVGPRLTGGGLPARPARELRRRVGVPPRLAGPRPRGTGRFYLTRGGQRFGSFLLCSG